MRKGEHVSDPASLTKKSWEAAGKVSPGEHKLRTQYNRLLAKYGPGWGETTQAKELAAYLSGVPVERGGGRGAQDPTYGGLTSWDQLDPDSEAYRQQLLEEMSTKAGRPGGGGIAGLKGIDLARARGNLTPDQYFNFRQQLMQAGFSACKWKSTSRSGKPCTRNRNGWQSLKRSTGQSTGCRARHCTKHTERTYEFI